MEKQLKTLQIEKVYQKKKKKYYISIVDIVGVLEKSTKSSKFSMNT